MCAIKPTHKKRLIVDVYTSDQHITAEQFQAQVLGIALETEIKLNSAATRFRWHVKETTQQAD